MRRRVVITGLGPITCAGIGIDAFWHGLRAERSGIRPITRFDSTATGVRSAGEIDDFDPARFFPPKRLRRLDRYAQFAVASALLALDDSRLEWSPDRPQPRIGVSFGTALGGVSIAEREYAHFYHGGLRAINPLLALQVFGGSAHSNIAIECGLQGPATTNSNSCASGTIAVGDALRMIRDNHADAVIAGGAEAPLSALTFGAFAIIKSMSRRDPPESCCPFDARRDGFVMGEGAASLVLEELDHARARNARIYAEVLGFGLTNDAHHMTSPRPDGSAAVAAMRAALDDAQIEPSGIDYINAHASSTPLNDACELRNTKTVFGPHARRIPISGTKPYTAHPLGASGAIEAVVCCLAIERGWIPPTLHHVQPDAECDLDVVPTHGRDHRVRRALSNSFGFGGINASIVLGAV